MASTRVVLPWSTWAMIAMLRIDSRCCIGSSYHAARRQRRATVSDCVALTRTRDAFLDSRTWAISTYATRAHRDPPGVSETIDLLRRHRRHPDRWRCLAIDRGSARVCVRRASSQVQVAGRTEGALAARRGSARARRGRESPTLCLIVPEGGPAILGVVALETLVLAVDPVGEAPRADGYVRDALRAAAVLASA